MNPAFVKYGPPGLLIGAFCLIAYALLRPNDKGSKGDIIATPVALLPQTPEPTPAPVPAPVPAPLEENTP